VRAAGVEYTTDLTITNSTISKNSGGGISNKSGTVTIANSNIAGNNGVFGAREIPNFIFFVILVGTTCASI